MLTVAGAVERLSEHPLAVAITAYAAAQGLLPGDDYGCCAAEAQHRGAAAACDCGCDGEPGGADGRATSTSATIATGTVTKNTTTTGTTATTAGPARRAAVRRFRAVPGMGVRAEVDGRLYFVGRPRLLGAAGEELALQRAVAALERQGKTAVVVGDEAHALGVIAVSDPLRPAPATRCGA